MFSRTLSFAVGLAGWLLILNLASAVSAQDQPKRYALLVGVDKYEHAAMNGDAPLKYATADVQELAQLLREAGYEVDLLVGAAASKEAIESRLALLNRKGNADGVVLVGLAGHGVQFEADEDAYFCPFDTTVREAERGSEKVSVLDRQGRPIIEPTPESCVKLTSIIDRFNLAPAGTRILLADCCRNDPTTGRGRAVGAGIKTDRLPGEHGYAPELFQRPEVV